MPMLKELTDLILDKSLKVADEPIIEGDVKAEKK